MTTITPEQLANHAQWLANPSSGERLNLRGADLRDANLWGADLRGANLRCANLWGATGLTIASDAPERLQAVAKAILNDTNALNMKTWHTGETTHCLGGWAIHQAGELGKLLEASAGPHMAGLQLLGVEAAEHFYDSNEDARAWLESIIK